MEGTQTRDLIPTRYQIRHAAEGTQTHVLIRLAIHYATTRRGLKLVTRFPTRYPIRHDVEGTQTHDLILSTTTQTHHSIYPLRHAAEGTQTHDSIPTRIHYATLRRGLKLMTRSRLAIHYATLRRGLKLMTRYRLAIYYATLRRGLKLMTRSDSLSNTPRRGGGSNS